VQRDLREIKGVTALIYEQTCAAEKRRRRKRKQYPDPPKRIFINELVCEGCGDCSKQSNCLSIAPVETEFGRKRKIDQSSCNKDYSCVKGFCPSFVSIEGGELRKPERTAIGAELEHLLATLPDPSLPVIDRAYDLLVGGVGGTGVVTIGAIITMAAHLERKGASVLDFMGFAQKGGTVLSYVRLAPQPQMLNQVRIDAGRANAAIICDLVVGTDPRALGVMRKGGTRAAANMEIIPTADFIRDRNVDFGAHLRLKTLKEACGEPNVSSLDASALAARLLGDIVYSNMLLLGYAWQLGLVPVSGDALRRAVALNGVAVKKNLEAFEIGRAAAASLKTVAGAAGLSQSEQQEPSLDEIVERRADFLTNYQNAAYADEYRTFVRKISGRVRNIPDNEAFVKAVARYLFKLMAYKDEYEVARLYTDGSFRKKVGNEFAGDYRIKFHMAPPIFNRGFDDQGRPKKSVFGPWMYGALSVLKHLKFLRGTAFDPFGRTDERKLERRMIADYRARMEKISARLDVSNLSVAVEIASLPDEIRGYGPVKLESIAKAEEKLARLMQRFEAAAVAKVA